MPMSAAEPGGQSPLTLRTTQTRRHGTQQPGMFGADALWQIAGVPGMNGCFSATRCRNTKEADLLAFLRPTVSLMREGFETGDLRIRLARRDERHETSGTTRDSTVLLIEVFATLPDIRTNGRPWQDGRAGISSAGRGIGWRKAQQFSRLHPIASNTRFLLLPDAGETPNPGNSVMAGMLRLLIEDRKQAWGYPLELAETFVEPRRFGGTAYRAGNRHAAGRSKGRPQQRALHRSPRETEGDVRPSAASRRLRPAERATP